MSYRDEYPVGSDDDDEESRLLRSPRRRTPLHMNSYHAQIEQVTRSRKRTTRRLRLLLASVAAVVVVSSVSWRYEATWSSLEVGAPPSLMVERVASICDSSQCIDVVPKTKVVTSDCVSLDDDHIAVLAQHALDTLYASAWPADVNFTCSRPRVLNASVVPAVEITAPLALCPLDIQVSGVLTQQWSILSVNIRVRFVDTATNVMRAMRSIYVEPGVMAVVSDGWDDQSIRGLPGIVPSGHDRGIWLGLAFSAHGPASRLNISVEDVTRQRKRAAMTVAVPPNTGLLGIRLDRDGSSWMPGDYEVVVAGLLSLKFIVLSGNDAWGLNYQLLREALQPLQVSNDTSKQQPDGVCSGFANNITEYCSCSKPWTSRTQQ
ncbi:hypothetical protein ACHHYP_05063 [Achlya hypogyna]|uniref:Transmembrane protein n=1 Tax=Achlya hypogyna TaxID=1202772 RepID=A0A1V9YZB4_ACHHY|nr:hypothetical protein ACHHYP_05063 [Achlya hypogyna]